MKRKKNETWVDRKIRLKRTSIQANTPQEVGAMLGMLSVEYEIPIKSLRKNKKWKELLVFRGLLPEDITDEEIKLGVKNKKKVLAIRKEESKLTKKKKK